MANASAGLVAALKASLADAADGWVVQSVSETLTEAESYNLLETESGYNMVSSSVSKTVTSVTMVGSALTADPDSAIQMLLTYQSVVTNDLFQFGYIVSNGAMWKTTDGALDTAVRSKMTSFLSAMDTRLTSALSSAPATVDVLPSDMLAAIEASLADPNAQWALRTVVKMPFGLGQEISMSLVSGTARVPVGTSLPAQIGYVARVDAKATLLESRILMSGASWRSTDTGLHSTLMAMAAAFQAAQKSAIIAGLED